MWTGFWTNALYFNRQRGRILWWRSLCMIIIIKAMKIKSKKLKSELAFLPTTSEASLPGTGQVSHEWMWKGEPTSSWQSSWEPDQVPRLPYLCFAEMPSSTVHLVHNFPLLLGDLAQVSASSADWSHCPPLRVGNSLPKFRELLKPFSSQTPAQGQAVMRKQPRGSSHVCS